MESATSTNFRLLQSLFDDRMNRLERAASRGEKGDAETELVKTYILEWTDHSVGTSNLRSALAGLFTTAPSSSFSAFRAAFADSDRLLHVTARHNSRRVSAYVDFTDQRFLRLHSTTKSDLLDDLVLGWTSQLPELDHAWLDDGFLDECASLGDFRALGVEFNNGPLTARHEDGDAEVSSDSIRLRQSGRPKAMLELLRGSATFNEQSSLAMVRLRYPRRIAEQHVTTEVRYDGRISGRGNSFIRHSEITDQIIQRYRAKVLNVESRFSMSAKAVGSGYALTGSPVKISLTPMVPDLALFCRRLFSGINPFRLSGVPRKLATDHYAVHAVDLHTAQTLRFEIRPHAIWAFLPAGTCGNTLLRLITNLKRHHSRLITADGI
jgi:hypothetical protein